MTNDSRLAKGGSCSTNLLGCPPAPEDPGQPCLWVYRSRGLVLQGLQVARYRVNQRERSPALFSASIDGRSENLGDLRSSVASWLDSAGINDADSEVVVLATHEAAAGAIEIGHHEFSILGAIERDAVVISLRTNGTTRPLDLTEREERARLLNRLASSVRVEATGMYSMLRLEFPARRG